MKVDSTALKALGVLELHPPISGRPFVMSHFVEDKSKGSLFDTIGSHCSTFQGRRMLNEWLRQPLLDRRLINERLDLVELLLASSAYVARKDLRNYLSLFPDLLRMAKRLERGSASLQEVARLYQVIKSLSKLLHLLSSLASIPAMEVKSGIDVLRLQFVYPLHVSDAPSVSSLNRKLSKIWSH